MKASSTSSFRANVPPKGASKSKSGGGLGGTSTLLAKAKAKSSKAAPFSSGTGPSIPSNTVPMAKENDNENRPEEGDAAAVLAEVDRNNFSDEVERSDADEEEEEDAIDYYNETLQELVEDKKSELLYMKKFLNKIADEVLPDRNLTQRLHMGLYRLLMNRVEEIEELMEILMSAISEDTTTGSSSSAASRIISLDIIQRASEYDIPEGLLQAAQEKLKEDAVVEQNRFWHGRNASAASSSSRSLNAGGGRGGAGSGNYASTQKQLLEQLQGQQAEEQQKLVESTEKLQNKMEKFWALHEKIENYNVKENSSSSANKLLLDEVLKFFDVYAQPLMLDLDCVLPAPNIDVKANVSSSASTTRSASSSKITASTNQSTTRSTSTAPSRNKNNKSSPSSTGQTLLQRLCNSAKLPHELQLRLLEHLLKKGAHMQFAVSYYVSAQMLKSQFGTSGKDAEQNSGYTFSHIEETMRLFFAHFQTQSCSISEDGTLSFHEEDVEKCIEALEETVSGKLNGFGYLGLDGGGSEDEDAATTPVTVLEATTLSHKVKDHLVSVFEKWKQKLPKNKNSSGGAGETIGLPLAKPWPQLFRDSLLSQATEEFDLKKVEQTIEQICAWNGKKILNEPVSSNTGANMLQFAVSCSASSTSSSSTRNSSSTTIVQLTSMKTRKPEVVKFLLKKLAATSCFGSGSKDSFFVTDVSGETVLQQALACPDDVSSVKQEVAQLLLSSETSAFNGLDLLHLKNFRKRQDPGLFVEGASLG
ncbi:unnamed protein product [Amoebophrya sp. A25]|nr:unnamed protein product [Amoebophrya sp. A25]|eukprot:GSA25T00019415001.1